MPPASTKGLCRAVERALPERPFSIEFWDGNRVPATSPGGATIRFRSPRAMGHVIRAPGQLGLGRAYVLGEIDVDDLDPVIALLGRWEAPHLGLGARARILTAALRAAGLRRPPPPPTAELQPKGRRHSRVRDARAVRHHYDVSNEFFALFLDDSMTYSCALFTDEGMTLEDAQAAKLELICRKLELEPGQRVLDIGCGWGSFAIHAAREHGVSMLGITLSEPQAELAARRVKDAGLDDQVEIRVMDYRELSGREFDAVASIGMIEHVGGVNMDEYAQRIAGVLRPGGRVLNHGITWTGSEVHIGDEFSERYVFPDGELPPLSRVLTAFERAGFEALQVEDMHRDYIQTLTHWIARLDENLEQAERLAGPERLRVWRLYLRAARNGFELGSTSVYQTLLTHPLTERGLQPAVASRPASAQAAPR